MLLKLFWSHHAKLGIAREIGLRLGSDKVFKLWFKSFTIFYWFYLFSIPIEANILS